MSYKNDVRFSMRLEKAVAEEVDRYASLAGVTRSAFLQMAIVIGMRALARQIAPEAFVTSDLLAKMREAGFSFPEGDIPDES